MWEGEPILAGMDLRAKAASMTQVTRSRVLTMALWSMIVLACGASVYNAVRPPSAPPPVKIPEPTVGPEGVAQLYVAAWLRGLGAPVTDASVYYPSMTPTAAVVAARPAFGETPPASPKVGRTVAVEARAMAAGYTAVVVAVEVGDAPIAVRYFRVPIYKTKAGLYVATELPAEVATPIGPKAPALEMDKPGEVKANDPMAVAVRGYLAALLTGAGDVSRFVSPGTATHPVIPAPYSTLTLTAMASAGPAKDKSVEVLAEAIGTDTAGLAYPLSYSFTLAQRAGRWEITRTLAGPTLSSTQPTLTPSSTVPVNPTTSTTSTTRIPGGKTP